MRPVVCATVVLVLTIPVSSAGRPSAPLRFELVSLTASVAETQQSFHGSASGDGSSELTLTAGNRPRARLAGQKGRVALAVRLRGSGSARANLVVHSRFGEPPGRYECSSAVDLAEAPRSARWTFARALDARGRWIVRIQLVLPYVRAPVIASADDPPTCSLGYATLRLRHVVPVAAFARRTATVTLSGTRRTTSGDTTYRTTWSVKLALRRL